MKIVKSLITLAALLWCFSALAAGSQQSDDNGMAILSMLVNAAALALIGFALGYVFRDKFNSIQAIINERFNSLEIKMSSADTIINERCIAHKEERGKIEIRVTALEEGLISIRPLIEQISRDDEFRKYNHGDNT